MRCCVPFCRNTPDNVPVAVEKSTYKEITFHSFPNEAHLRAAWLRALGKQDRRLPDCAVVCSQHFLREDMYETEIGFRQINPSGVPSTVQMCMICLDTDCDLILLRKNKLEEQYVQLTGYPLFQLPDQGNIKQTVCVQCAQRLIDYSQFREQSLRARSLMMELLEKYELITIQHVKRIDRTKNQLVAYKKPTNIYKCNFVSTILGPDQCDLHIVEDNDEYKQTESQETVIVKEECYDAMCVEEDEETEVKTEDNNLLDKATAVCVVSREEYSVSDESILLDAKILDEALQEALRSQAAASSSIVAARVSRIQDRVKSESATYNCSLCFEEFFHEHEYNRHMSMHLPSGDVASGSEPPAARSSRDSVHKSVFTGTVRRPPTPPHTHAVPAGHATPATVAPSAAKLVTRQQISLAPTEEADTINRSLKVHEANEDNQSRGSTNTTNTEMKRFTNEVPSTETKGNASTACRRKNLIQHVKIHTGEKPYSCTLCNYKCAIKSHLVGHMRTHSGEKPYSCTLCKYKCSIKSHLVRHIKTHTGEKPYSCTLCNYKCVRKNHLGSHMRTHTGEKPYSCTLCNFKSAWKTRLAIHVRTHTGEKPYSCTLCNYNCVEKGYLVKHMRTHTGEKPYSCTLCNFQSAWRNRLVIHMKTHAG